MRIPWPETFLNPSLEYRIWEENSTENEVLRRIINSTLRREAKEAADKAADQAHADRQKHINTIQRLLSDIRKTKKRYTPRRRIIHYKPLDDKL